MSSSESATPSTPLTEEAVLDELEFLATVEHALIVEYLTASYALGYGLDDASAGGTTAGTVSDAANAFSNLAQTEMAHLRRINFALAGVGRDARMDRAARLPDDPARAISLEPPDLTQLRSLVVREQAIAAAVDARYAKLTPAVTSAPVFDDDHLPGLRQVIVDDGPVHADAVKAVTDQLAGLTPEVFLRATHRDTTDPFEQSLLDVSDRAYGVVVGVLSEQFDQAKSEPLAALSPLAFPSMQTLDGICRLLVQRGLLPPFNP